MSVCVLYQILTGCMDGFVAVWESTSLHRSDASVTMMRFTPEGNKVVQNPFELV